MFKSQTFFFVIVKKQQTSEINKQIKWFIYSVLNVNYWCPTIQKTYKNSRKYRLFRVHEDQSDK